VNFVQQQYTGARCQYGYHQYVVQHFPDAGGVEQYVAQHGLRWWEAGCSDNEAVKAGEQQR
jgi:hypothetical protein